MAGTPSGLVWAPAGTGAPAGAPVREGWVLAPVILGGHVPDGRARGVVEALGRAPDSTAPMESLTRAVLTAGVGMEGDRYAGGRGRFSEPGGPGQELTLIEAEALEALGRDHGIELAPIDARRNVVTRGIDLNALVGRHFRVGRSVLRAAPGRAVLVAAADDAARHAARPRAPRRTARRHPGRRRRSRSGIPSSPGSSMPAMFSASKICPTRASTASSACSRSRRST